MTKINFTSDGENRLDKQIAENSELTRSAAVKLLEKGLVTVNGKSAGKKDVPPLGAEIEISMPEARPVDILPENLPLEIVYEDDDVLVVNKPKGMVVHPAAWHYS